LLFRRNSARCRLAGIAICAPSQAAMPASAPSPAAAIAAMLAWDGPNVA
jgi:hypothetical protein